MDGSRESAAAATTELTAVRSGGRGRAAVAIAIAPIALVVVMGLAILGGRPASEPPVAVAVARPSPIVIVRTSPTSRPDVLGGHRNRFTIDDQRFQERPWDRRLMHLGPNLDPYVK